MIKYFFTFILFINFLFLIDSSSQPVAIGQWRDHLPLASTIEVAEAPERVYCASAYGVIVYNKANFEIEERLTTATGLSGIDITTIKYHPHTNSIIIGYADGNIDVVIGEDILNVGDIKRSSIVANKRINKIISSGKYAYLSCGFGVVILNMETSKVADTYLIGKNGTYINVQDIAFHKNSIYAATTTGLYYASLSSPNLANFTFWQKDTLFPSGVALFTEIEVFNNNLYINFSNEINDQSDTLYTLNNGKWERIDAIISNKNRKLEAYDSKMIITHKWTGRIYNKDWSVEGTIITEVGAPGPNANHTILGSDGQFWTADKHYGLIRNVGIFGSDIITPNAPSEINSYSILAKKNRVIVSTGTRAFSNGTNFFFLKGLMMFTEEKWNSINQLNTQGMDTIYDILYSVIDPNDEKRIFSSSLGKGLLEFYDHRLVNVYDGKNSILEAPESWKDHFAVSGLAFDNQNNLWMINPDSDNPIKVKTPTGTWNALTATGLSRESFIEFILITQSGNKWITVPNKGICVFNDNNTIDNPTDDQSIFLNSGSGTGNLPGLGRLAIAEDLNGDIWVGTDKGIAVFNNSNNILNGENVDAQKILVEKDGHYEFLFEKEVVTAIAVDGANRKWVGTDGAGIFLISADGTEEIHHFTRENSPLVSNIMSCIAIEPASGEVFIGTEQGIISYRGTATEGADFYEDVYAFPNPVLNTYEGPIAIKGLVANSTIKIADVSGNILFETLSEGGQAIWNGKNQDGEKIETGVYFVFGTTELGDQKMVSKILVIR